MVVAVRSNDEVTPLYAIWRGVKVHSQPTKNKSKAEDFIEFHAIWALLIPKNSERVNEFYP